MLPLPTPRPPQDSSLFSFYRRGGYYPPFIRRLISAPTGVPTDLLQTRRGHVCSQSGEQAVPATRARREPHQRRMGCQRTCVSPPKNRQDQGHTMRALNLHCIIPNPPPKLRSPAPCILPNHSQHPASNSGKPTLSPLPRKKLFPLRQYYVNL